MKKDTIMNFMRTSRAGLLAGVTASVLLMSYPAAQAFIVVNNLASTCQDPEGPYCNVLMVYGDGGFSAGPIVPGQSVNIDTDKQGLYIAGNPVSYDGERGPYLCKNTNDLWPSLFDGLSGGSTTIYSISLQSGKIVSAMGAKAPNGTVSPVFQTYETCSWTKLGLP